MILDKIVSQTNKVLQWLDFKHVALAVTGIALALLITDYARMLRLRSRMV